MRRSGLGLVVVLAALLLSGRAEAQDFIRYYPPAGVSFTGGTVTTPILFPDGTASAPSIAFSSDADGTGTGFYRSAANQIAVVLNGSTRASWASTGTLTLVGLLTFNSSDGYDVGQASAQAKEFFLARSIQGSKSKALTEASATSFVRVAVAQTAGANYGGGSVGYTVYATDGTDSQSLVGDVRFAMVNKAGAETCVAGEVGTPVLGASSGTLTCTFTCATAAADTVDLSANCTSSLVQTTFTIESRGNMQKTNTWTPQ